MFGILGEPHTFTKTDSEALTPCTKKDSVDLIQKDPLSVTESSKKDQLESILEAINALTKLHGIGPATATAILSAQYPFVPFMSDECLVYTLGIEKKQIRYTIKEFTQMYHYLAECLYFLPGWNMRDCERTVWTMVQLEKHGIILVLDKPEKGVKHSLSSTSSPKKRSRLEGV